MRGHQVRGNQVRGPGEGCQVRGHEVRGPGEGRQVRGHQVRVEPRAGGPRLPQIRTFPLWEKAHRVHFAGGARGGGRVLPCSLPSRSPTKEAPCAPCSLTLRVSTGWWPSAVTEVSCDGGATRQPRVTHGY